MFRSFMNLCFYDRAYIRPVQKRPNLHILLNTTVARVLVHPQTKSTHGVEIIDEFGHPMKIFSKKEVIVAGGTVNSPQILLLSGIGPKEDLVKVRLWFTFFEALV